MYGGFATVRRIVGGESGIQVFLWGKCLAVVVSGGRLPGSQWGSARR